MLGLGMSKVPVSAYEYRQRADELEGSLKKRGRKAQHPMLKKQKALRDMADNEDWLAGVVKPKA